MNAYRLLTDAEHRIGEIYHYSLGRWGEAQADRYYHGLIDTFEAIAARTMPWRPIPAELEVQGYRCRYQRHFIYWRLLEDGTVGIVTVLHECMHQPAIVREAFDD